VLTHYEAIKTEVERFRFYLRSRTVATILDESTKIKNPESTLTQIFFELSPLFERRVIMTGTPVANRPYDIWAQVWFLDRGASLGNDFFSFRRETDLSVDLAKDQCKRSSFESALSSIYSRIEQFSVRETKDSGVIELPEKMIHTVVCDWERRQLDLYRQVRERMRALVIKEGLLTEDNVENVLKRMLRLVQVCSNPRLIDESYRESPGKLLRLQELVSKIQEASEKCIVWTSFTENADWLASELTRFGTAKVHGKLDMERRHNAVERFLEDNSINVLVATPGAAKEGLTLTVANHAIFYDRSFSLDDYLQAQDRVHRISQKKKCHVYKIIMQDSIDEWVDALLESKRMAALLAQGDISIEYYRDHVSYEPLEMIGEILGQADSKHSDKGSGVAR
jgi:SNF2 family DNA or RNA helicase